MLRDIMGAADLSFFAQVSLVLFFLVFLALVLYLFVTRGSPHWDEARYMPLDDENPGRVRLPPDEEGRSQ